MDIVHLSYLNLIIHDIVYCTYVRKYLIITLIFPSFFFLIIILLIFCIVSREYGRKRHRGFSENLRVVLTNISVRNL